MFENIAMNESVANDMNEIKCTTWKCDSDSKKDKNLHVFSKYPRRKSSFQPYTLKITRRIIFRFPE